MVKTVTVDKLLLKEHLSIIEQFALKDFLFKWLGRPNQESDDFLPLEYNEDVFAKMEVTYENDFLVQNDEQFRYVTLTEDNKIVIGVLNTGKELQHKIISLDEVK
jgi:hypothetical protein